MKKEKCVITEVHNEKIFFDVWYSYYSKFFNPEHIYIIHDLKPIRCKFDDWLVSASRSFGFNIIDFFNEKSNNGFEMTEFANHIINNILSSYKKVLYTDIDEFICHHNGLNNFIDNWNGQIETLNGFEVVHMYKRFPEFGVNFDPEPDLDISLPILKQRKWWYHSRIYSKPLLTSIPINYCAGFHYCKEIQDPIPNPDLYLIHLQKADYKISVQRRVDRANNDPLWITNMQVDTSTPGFQTRLMGQWLDDWWFRCIDDLSIRPPAYCEIPDNIKEFPI